MRKSTWGWLAALGAVGMIGAGLATRSDAQEAAGAGPGGLRQCHRAVEGRPFSRERRCVCNDRLPVGARGSAVAVDSLPGQALRGHIEINRRLSEPGYEATAKVDDWLKRVISV